MKTIVLIALAAFITGLFIWATNSSIKQTKKDWDTLKELKEKANKVRTKEEIEEFHEEFLDKARKINNQFINIELSKIDGYLRGMYQQYKT